MTDANLDARARRSREALLKAMGELMIERGYDRTSIQHLLDRADVGRATFYAHFESKEDLLAQSIDGLKQWLLQQWRARQARDPDVVLGFSLGFFLHVDSHRRIYDAIVGRKSQAMVEAYIRRVLKDLTRQDLDTRYPPVEGDEATRAFAVEFVVGALWSCTVWWLSTRAPLDGTAVDRLFARGCLPGLEPMMRAATPR